VRGGGPRLYIPQAPLAFDVVQMDEGKGPSPMMREPTTSQPDSYGGLHHIRSVFWHAPTETQLPTIEVAGMLPGATATLYAPTCSFEIGWSAQPGRCESLSSAP